MTKPLAALAVLVAVEEEAVGLDDPADEQLVPGATLRHLLAHASGLAPERRMRASAPGTRRIYSNVGIERAADAGRGRRPGCRSPTTSPRRCSARCG